MPKFTRLIKNKKNRNKTLKGGNKDNSLERKGVMDLIGDKLSDATSNIVDKAQDIGLNALGLEKINKEPEPQQDEQEPGMLSKASNIANETTASVIDNVNEVLGSDQINESVKQAGEDTAAITGKLAETFNDAMDDPQVKAEVEEAIENAGEIANVVAKASEQPIKQATKVAVEAGTDALASASSGAVRIGTDILAALPGVGAIFDFGRMINDSSKAASAMVEAGSEAIEAGSDAFIQTKENVEKGLKELEEKKKMANQITNRTNKSINEFMSNDINNNQSGGYKKNRKTKRRMFKRKLKSKRVRFAI